MNNLALISNTITTLNMYFFAWLIFAIFDTNKSFKKKNLLNSVSHIPDF